MQENKNVSSMSNVGESSFGLPAVGDDKCPICNRKKHKTTKDKEENKGQLESIPENLECETIPQHPDIAYYATAAHHIIPVNQCLAKFHRLRQMAEAVGYNVNNKKNGLSLPTVGQQNENNYYLNKLQYGELELEDKKEVAFEVMEYVDSLKPKITFGAQWHPSHHNWSFDTVKKLSFDTDDIPHNDTNYEEKVNRRLKDIEANLVEDKSKCKRDANGERGRDVIKKLDNLSTQISYKIRRWKTYYVSAMSYVYSKERK